ncbi:MAG TPA: autotransporter-associated beta strand repeat-containing protein [Chthoniobacteraceae bacterium]|nr:autotransporter-associated beta strand repeat-containing protein [Chthoniobacteraceae bacterium]
MKPRLFATPILAAALLSFIPGPRVAAQVSNTFELTSSGNANWNDAANWTRTEGSDSVPQTVADKAIVSGNSGDSRNLVVNANGIHLGEMEYSSTGTSTQRLEADSGSSRLLKIGTLTKNGAYVLSIRNNAGTLAVEIGDFVHNTNEVVIGQASSLEQFTVTGTSTIGANGIFLLAGVQGGIIQLGNLDLAGSLVLGGRGYSSGTVSVASLKGSGDIQVSSSSNHNGTAGTLLIESTNATPTTFSGILRDYQSSLRPAVLTVRKAGAGTQILSRSAGNTYTGTTTIEGGVLAVTNTSGSGLGTGAVVVEAGGALAGSGLIAPGAGNGITVRNGGVVAPSAHLATGFAALTLDGTATGSEPLLTLNEGAAFTFRFGAGDASDRIEFTGYEAGKLALFAGGIAVNGLEVLEGTFTLLSFNTISTSEIAELGGLLTIGSGFGGYNATFSWEENAILLNVAAIPEPGLAGLLLLGAGALGVARLRRKALC